jgi:hypothetical protein
MAATLIGLASYAQDSPLPSSDLPYRRLIYFYNDRNDSQKGWWIFASYPGKKGHSFRQYTEEQFKKLKAEEQLKKFNATDYTEEWKKLADQHSGLCRPSIWIMPEVVDEIYNYPPEKRCEIRWVKRIKSTINHRIVRVNNYSQNTYRLQEEVFTFGKYSEFYVIFPEPVSGDKEKNIASCDQSLVAQVLAGHATLETEELPPTDYYFDSNRGADLEKFKKEKENPGIKYVYPL